MYITNTLLKGGIEGLSDNHLHLHMHPDPKKALARFIEEGGSYLLEVCVHPYDFQKVLDIKRLEDSFNRKDLIFIAFGIHPEYVKPEYSLADSEKTRRFSLIEDATQQFDAVFTEHSDYISVIGEVGYDIYRVETFDVKKTLNLQDRLLAYFIEFAKMRTMPLMFHIRSSDESDFSLYERALKMLEEFGIFSADDLKVYFHSFTAGKKIAQEIVNRGFFIGINGIVTYSPASELQEALKSIPQDRILFETDSPFLVPRIKGGRLQFPNEPRNVRYIIEKVKTLTR